VRLRWEADAQASLTFATWSACWFVVAYTPLFSQWSTPLEQSARTFEASVGAIKRTCQRNQITERYTWIRFYTRIDILFRQCSFSQRGSYTSTNGLSITDLLADDKRLPGAISCWSASTCDVAVPSVIRRYTWNVVLDGAQAWYIHKWISRQWLHRYESTRLVVCSGVRVVDGITNLRICVQTRLESARPESSHGLQFGRRLKRHGSIWLQLHDIASTLCSITLWIIFAFVYTPTSSADAASSAAAAANGFIPQWYIWICGLQRSLDPRNARREYVGSLRTLSCERLRRL